jgi:hypothetical protein
MLRIISKIPCSNATHHFLNNSCNIIVGSNCLRASGEKSLLNLKVRGVSSFLERRDPAITDRFEQRFVIALVLIGSRVCLRDGRQFSFVILMLLLFPSTASSTLPRLVFSGSRTMANTSHRIAVCSDPRIGNSTTKVVPFPSPSLRAWIVPACISTMALLIARPSPNPSLCESACSKA